MATCGRIFFVILAELSTVACFGCAIVAFFGCYKSGGGLSNVYNMKTDLSNILVNGVSLSTALGASNNGNLHQVYQVGLQGYCYGDYKNNSLEIANCLTPQTPYWFDIVSILQENLPTAIYNDLRIPSSVASYSKIVRDVSYATWALVLAEFVLAVLVALVGFIGLCTPNAGSIASWISVLMSLVGIAGAALCTGTWVIYSNRVNDAIASFGAKTNIGSSGIGLLWAAAAAAALATILWSISSCCGGSRRRVTSQEPLMYEGKGPFVSYHR